MPSTEINTLNIAYQVAGAGDVVLLLHGWGGEAASFQPVFDWLAQSHTVYALDLPGFGKSQIPPTAWNYLRLCTVCYCVFGEVLHSEGSLHRPLLWR